MEGWLSNQTIPFERLPGRVGAPSDTCAKGKNDPKRCRGIAGLATTEVSIVDTYNATYLTLVFEDDWFAENITRPQESIRYCPMIEIFFDLTAGACPFIFSISARRTRK
jgi:hypothetical protein